MKKSVNVTNRVISLTAQNMLENTKCLWQGHRGKNIMEYQKFKQKVLISG